MKARLHTVLEIRRNREDEVKRFLGGLERERSGILAMRAALERDLCEAAERTVPLAQREQLAAFAAASHAAVADCDRQTIDCEARIDAVRVQLAAAHRDVRAIEALQARDRATARRTAAQREGRDTDEIAARRHQEMIA